MVIPFVPEKRKAVWAVDAQIPEIEWAIREDSDFRFIQEIKSLYSGLAEFGIVMPRIEPIQMGAPIYDNTWWEYHRFWLGELRQRIKAHKFNLEQWNREVSINDSHRHKAAEKEREFYQKEDRLE